MRETGVVYPSAPLVDNTEDGIEHDDICKHSPFFLAFCGEPFNGQE